MHEGHVAAAEIARTLPHTYVYAKIVFNLPLEQLMNKQGNYTQSQIKEKKQNFQDGDMTIHLDMVRGKLTVNTCERATARSTRT